MGAVLLLSLVAISGTADARAPPCPTYAAAACQPCPGGAAGFRECDPTCGVTGVQSCLRQLNDRVCKATDPSPCEA
ncbi:MAG: hypothetical protein ACT4PT_14630 [Methanobacteriota archaeon]